MESTKANVSANVPRSRSVYQGERFLGETLSEGEEEEAAGVRGLNELPAANERTAVDLVLCKVCGRRERSKGNVPLQLAGGQ